MILFPHRHTYTVHSSTTYLPMLLHVYYTSSTTGCGLTFSVLVLHRACSTFFNAVGRVARMPSCIFRSRTVLIRLGPTWVYGCHCSWFMPFAARYCMYAHLLTWHGTRTFTTWFLPVHGLTQPFLLVTTPVHAAGLAHDATRMTPGLRARDNVLTLTRMDRLYAVTISPCTVQLILYRAQRRLVPRQYTAGLLTDTSYWFGCWTPVVTFNIDQVPTAACVTCTNAWRYVAHCRHRTDYGLFDTGCGFQRTLRGPCQSGSLSGYAGRACSAPTLPVCAVLPDSLPTDSTVTRSPGHCRRLVRDAGRIRFAVRVTGRA